MFALPAPKQRGRQPSPPTACINLPARSGARMRLLVPDYPAAVIKRVGEDNYRKYFGMLCSPASEKPPEKAALMGAPWALDNGAFVGFNPIKFIGWLERCKKLPGCLWVVAPDVVQDAEGTLKLFWAWHDIIRAYGYPVAFVAQNGIEKTEIPWDKFECLFIGGDDQFKLGDQAARLIKEARLRGKLVHMGRVNTQQRIRLAEAYGCDSVDGSSFARWPSCLEQHLSTILEVNNRVPLLEVV